MGVPISNVTRRVVYAASGTGPYAFTFEILANTDIAVYKDDTLLTLTTDYTVTIASNGTGSITLVASPTGATQIAIVGNRTIQRTTDFVTGGDFFANTVNDEMDQQTIFAQQNAEGLQRALQAPQTDPTSINMTLPRKADRAGKYLAFDADGNPEPGPTSSDVDVVAGIADEVVTVAGISSSVTTVAGISSAVSTVSGNSSNVTTVAGVSGNVTTVAGISSNVTTVAGISANVSTVAGISSAVSGVAAISSAVSAVNSNSSNINTVSGISAAVSSVAADATDIGTVAASIADVNTVADDIADVTTCADNIAAIIDAPTQATNAANSASAAASSAASAASALDSFDDRYLGSKSSDPTVDNDGNALVTGALYYNSSTQVMKVYDGANWIAATAAGTTSMLVYKYVATAGQTTFSGAASVGGTMSYTSGNILVFVNGASLDSTDYTATNGTSVVLASAASLNDEVVIVAFKSFTVADTYTQSQVDAFAVKLTGDQTIAGVKTFSGATTVMNGNVGIGTSSPIQLLTVESTSNVRATIRNSTESTSYSSSLDFATGSGSLSNSNIVGRVVGVITQATPSTLKGDLAFHTNSGDNSAERMRIDSSGNLLVGTTSTGGVGGISIRPNLGGAGTYGRIEINQNQNADGVTFSYNGTQVGRINVGTSSTAYVTSSDYRLKENVQPMTGGLNTVAQLKPCIYTWKATGEVDQGFIAHELQEVFPAAVTGEKDAVNEDGSINPQGIDTSFLVATLTAAIQEQQAQIEQLTERLSALENK